MLDAGASSSSSVKAPPPKKERNRPYMNVEIAQALYDQNSSVDLRDVHLPGGWHLNARRVLVPSVPRCGRERWDKIRHRWAILPPDLCEDSAFAMDFEWWVYPTYEPCPRHRSSLLGDEEYDYGATVNTPQQVPRAPPEEEEAEEVVIPVEEYQPQDLSEEEAIRPAMEESNLLELGLWDGLGTQLQASTICDRAAPPLPPPPPPAPELEP
jgi:hypothetical protein